MPKDKFDFPYFYATKDGGFVYEQSDDIESDAEFSCDEISATGSDGMFTVHYQGPTSWVFKSDPSYNDNSIGGSNMDFPDTEERGYQFKPTDIKAFEFKFLMSVEDGGDHGLSIGGPTGDHGGSGNCSGFAYMVNVQYDTDPAEFRFRKEMWHVSYHTDPKTGDGWTHPSVNFKLNGHGWVGYSFVRYNVKDGVSAGHDSVILELWFNPNPDVDKSNWIMLKRTEDKGGWGDDGDQCGGESDQVGSWGGCKWRIKSNDDDAHISFKNVSFREIDPTKSFEDDPIPPDETPTEIQTILGSYVVKWDINQLRTSPCAGAGTGGGGGGGTGNATFYNVYTLQGVDSDKELSNTSTWDNRKRIVMSPANSSSVFAGKLPIQLDIPLKRSSGVPAATPLVYAKIWSPGGSVIYTSPTTFDPSAFTTSYVKKTFDFSTNTHVLVTGDRIGIEYTGSSSSNYVIASYKGTSYPNTNYYQYEGSIWQSKTRRLVMDVWQ